MATAHPQLDTLIGLFECPVCFESYEDPYIIKCGHHFCRKCLEGIANEHPQGSVTCPTCRQVTNFNQGSRVTDLPRPVLVNKLQEKISSFLHTAKHRKLSRYCDHGGDQKVTAASYCYQCQLSMCDQCCTKHLPMEAKASHRVVPLADSMFCESHPAQVTQMVCEDCDRGICPRCLLDAHSGHNVTPTSQKAGESRGHLQEFIDSKETWDKDTKLIDEIKDKFKEAKTAEANVSDLVSRLRGLLKELEATLDQLETDTRTKLTAQAKMLTIREEETRDLMVSRQSLIDHAIYLTQKASDQELIKQAKTFPTSAKLAVSTEFQDKSIQKPVFDNLQKLCSNLQQMITDCKVNFRTEKLTLRRLKGISKQQKTINSKSFKEVKKKTSEVDNQMSGITMDVKKLTLTSSKDTKKPQTIKSKSIKDIKKQQTIKVGYTMLGITMDVQRHKLVVRTNDNTGLLKVYDYRGRLQESLGAGVTGRADDNYERGICMDTKRGCYVTSGPSSLLVVDIRAGHLIKSVRVGGYYNCGVAYGEHNDIYVMSDFKHGTVYLIDPHTSQVTRQFVSYGSGPSQFSGPYNVQVGNVAGTKPVIIVSNQGNHCVKVFDTSGQYIKTYGSQGSGDNQLSWPWSVCTDHNGSLLVSDCGNYRVMMISRDDSGQDHWERLLYNDWDGSGLWLLTLNTSDMVLAVSNNNRDTLYIYT